MDCPLPAAQSAGLVLRWRLLAALLILGSALARIWYLLSDCPLDLAPDEAHYWDWSRHLDWSYYSKGPLIAYLIRLGCTLFGPWSTALTGNEMVAVRMPAVACGALILLGLYVLTVQVFRRESLAAAVVAVALTWPVLAAGSALMTIDAPYCCCWCWALVAGYRAAVVGSRWAWPVAGLLVGLGILAKYTMVLWIPSFGVFLLLSPKHRRLLLGPGFWILVAVAGFCCIPILIWNIRNDWVTYRHVSSLAGLSEDTGTQWTGPWRYVYLQFALLLGIWFVVWLRALIAYLPWPSERAETPSAYLWWMSVPMFIVFLAFSLKTGGGEPNWPITAYLSGAVLSAGWLREQFLSGSRIERRLATAAVWLGCFGGALVTAAVHRSELIYPILARAVSTPSEENPMPLRRVDPTCRLRGWSKLADTVEELRAQLRQSGSEPLLAASGWSLPGEIAFYLKDHPTVYSFGLGMGDRHSQYDLWRPNPVQDGTSFPGFHERDFIFVGEGSSLLQLVFGSVGPTRIVTHQVNGQTVARWSVTVCRDFQGFEKLLRLFAGQRSF
jgi:hypothetical protein